MASRSKPRFTGFLNDPIITYPFLEFFVLDYENAADEFERDEFIAKHERWLESIHEERLEKLVLLLRHYDVARDDPDRWRRLAFRMALDFVPGMRVEYEIPRQRGRPRKWKGELGKIFYRHIQAINKERGRGVRDAIRTLLKRLGDSSNGLITNAVYPRNDGDELKTLSDELSGSKRSNSAVRTLEARYHELAREEGKATSKRHRTSPKSTKKAR
jgi:hypothetical protein